MYSRSVVQYSHGLTQLYRGRLGARVSGLDHSPSVVELIRPIVTSTVQQTSAFSEKSALSVKLCEKVSDQSGYSVNIVSRDSPNEDG